MPNESSYLSENIMSETIDFAVIILIVFYFSILSFFVLLQLISGVDAEQK